MHGVKQLCMWAVENQIISVLMIGKTTLYETKEYFDLKYLEIYRSLSFFKRVNSVTMRIYVEKGRT